MIQPSILRARLRHSFQIVALFVMAIVPVLLVPQTAHAATISLEDARACYEALNGKLTVDTRMTNADCAQVCVAQSGTAADTKWECINPDAAALTDDTRTIKRLYGAAVGDTLCKQPIAIERAACIDVTVVAVTDCINSWVTTLSDAELKDFLISDIDTDAVATCTATKLGKSKAIIMAALNEAKEPIDSFVDSAVKEKEDAETAAANAGTVCAGGTMGWILCPLTTLMTDAITFLAESTEIFLRLEPLIGSDQGTAVRSVWSVVVGVANLLLVVAFLVVIFSQATSVGLSAYGIKKMLPRIIAAAILINLSYFICAIMVDVTNIIGASIQGIITSASGSIGKGSAADAPSFGIAVVETMLIIAVPAAFAVATGSIALVVPILVSGLVSLVFLFIVLALRHVLAILLIILSPLAFAAMILPNTNGLFKKWWKAFYISLALYPIIMLLAYGSQLVSKIILSTAPDKWPESWIWAVFGFIVLFAWIWALKSIVTLGGGIASKLTGIVNDKSKGLIDRPKNWAKQKSDNSTFRQIRAAKKNAVNTNAQRRTYDRMGRGLGKGYSQVFLGKETGQFLQAQVDEQNSKIHDSRVRYALQATQKKYDAKNRDVGSTNGLVALAQAAQSAAASGDQVAFDAYASHAASGGADEYRLFHEILQGKGPEGVGGKYKIDSSKNEMFGDAMRYVSATQGADLGSKNPALAALLQKGNATVDIADHMDQDSGMRKMYNKVGADKHAAYSSDTATVAAKYATDDVIRELIENPGGKHSLGDSARKAYQAEYDKIKAGERREYVNGDYTKPSAGMAPEAPATPSGPTAQSPDGQSFVQSDSGLFIPRDR